MTNHPTVKPNAILLQGLGYCLSRIKQNPLLVEMLLEQSRPQSGMAPPPHRARIGFRDLLRLPTTRCVNIQELQVHYVLTTAGSMPENAQMLCDPCHKATETFGTHGPSPESFPEHIKALARVRAQNQCECTSEHPGHGY